MNRLSTSNYPYFFSSVALVLSSLLPAVASAQDAGGAFNAYRPPVVPLVDENGVNLQTGDVEHESTGVSIGTGDASLQHGLVSRDGVFSPNGALSDNWVGGVDSGAVWQMFNRETTIPGVTSGPDLTLAGIKGQGSDDNQTGYGRGERGPPFKLSQPVIVNILGQASKFSPGYIDSNNPSVISHYPQVKDGSFLFSQGIVNVSNAPEGENGEYGHNFINGTRFTYIDREGNEYISDFVLQAHSANLRPFGGLRKIKYNNGKEITLNYEYKMVPDTLVEGFFGWWRLRSVVSNYGYMLHYTYQDNRPYGQTAIIESQMGPAEYIASVTAVDTNVDNCPPLATTCTYSRNWPKVTYQTTGQVDLSQGGTFHFILGSPTPPLTVLPGTPMYSTPEQIPTYTLTTTNAAGEANQYLIKRGSGYDLSIGTFCLNFPNIKLTKYPNCMGSVGSSGLFSSTLGAGAVDASGQSLALKRDYTYRYIGGVGGFARNPYGSTEAIPLYPYVGSNCPDGNDHPATGSAVVSSVMVGGRLWKYDYCSNGLTRAIVTNPLGGKKIYEFGFANLNSGSIEYGPPDQVLNSVTDENGRVTRFAYESKTLLTFPLWRQFSTPFNPNPVSITYPEGNSDVYTYDARGNVTSKTLNPKPGSGLNPIIEFQANFDATCSNYVKCNKPNWTKDANGNQTDYVYNSRGFIERIIGPVDANGIRPTTTYGYANFPTGDGSSLYLLTSTTVSIDATRSTTTLYDYDPNNHWTMKSKTEDAGGLNILTCYKYDNLGNKVSETEPLGNTTTCP